MFVCACVFCYHGKVGTRLDWWANIELGQFDRERKIRALTDTIRYEYSLCHGVPATYRTGRSLRERSLYAMGGTLHPRLNNADH